MWQFTFRKIWQNWNRFVELPRIYIRSCHKYPFNKWNRYEFSLHFLFWRTRLFSWVWNEYKNRLDIIVSKMITPVYFYSNICTFQITLQSHKFKCMIGSTTLEFKFDQWIILLLKKRLTSPFYNIFTNKRFECERNRSVMADWFGNKNRTAIF